MKTSRLFKTFLIFIVMISFQSSYALHYFDDDCHQRACEEIERYEDWNGDVDEEEAEWVYNVVYDDCEEEED